MTENIIYISLGLFALGALFYFFSNKKRNDESQEWSGSLQWGYLLMMIGIFGTLANFMSFTAVLLIFVFITLILWTIQRIQHKKKHEVGHFVDYLGGFFPIVLVVFVLRTFIAEPFVIPSSSMRPGLIVGDFVLVNKFAYGIRLPILNTVIIPTSQVQSGDVAVFNYPVEPSVNYIKRIVGVPGDKIQYIDKILTINGKEIEDQFLGEDSFVTDRIESHLPLQVGVKTYREQIGTHQFDIFQIPGTPTLDITAVSNDDTEHCHYQTNGFTCTVPEGQYFAMGDNRDNSADSRYWGFVDDKLMVGKAWIIWLNFTDMNRIGTRIQ